MKTHSRKIMAKEGSGPCMSHGRACCYLRVEQGCAFFLMQKELPASSKEPKCLNPRRIYIKVVSKE